MCTAAALTCLVRSPAGRRFCVPDLPAGCELQEGYRSALFTACQPTICCSKDGKNAVALSVSHTPSRCRTNNYSVYPFELGIGNSLMEISNYELACIISYLAFCLEEFVYLPLLSSALFSVFIFHRNKKQKKRRHQNVKHKGSE